MATPNVCVNIYILLLEQQKYYVGRTTSLHTRVLEHFNHSGSQWTKLYRPVSVYEFHENCDLYDEDKFTIKTMARFGINNVRGGSFARVVLSDTDLTTINKIILNVSDHCFNCGLYHFIKDCPYVLIADEFSLYLQKTIMTKCMHVDTTKSGCVNTMAMKNILVSIDDSIFDDITVYNVKHICRKINKLKLKGLFTIDVENINYVAFSIGVAYLLANV